MRLEPPLRRAGWNVVTVASSFEVLRAVRDHDVGILLIDPELPGAGVSGVDVVRTLKSAARFRQLPVFFLLRSGQGPPAGVMADALDGATRDVQKHGLEEPSG
jgi:DNA-binding response OmpR family regulator